MISKNNVSMLLKNLKFFTRIAIAKICQLSGFLVVNSSSTTSSDDVSLECDFQLQDEGNRVLPLDLDQCLCIFQFLIKDHL